MIYVNFVFNFQKIHRLIRPVNRQRPFFKPSIIYHRLYEPLLNKVLSYICLPSIIYHRLYEPLLKKVLSYICAMGSSLLAWIVTVSLPLSKPCPLLFITVPSLFVWHVPLWWGQNHSRSLLFYFNGFCICLFTSRSLCDCQLVYTFWVSFVLCQNHDSIQLIVSMHH